MVEWAAELVSHLPMTIDKLDVLDPVYVIDFCETLIEYMREFRNFDKHNKLGILVVKEEREQEIVLWLVEISSLTLTLLGQTIW